MSSVSLAPSSNVLPGNFTIATLPAVGQSIGMFAWCTDLHDNQPGYVVSDGTFWKPQVPHAMNVANANQANTFTCLVNSPYQILNGALTANRSNAFSTTNAYKGAFFWVLAKATGTLVSVSVDGISLGLTSWGKFVYDGSAWQEMGSGGLL